MGKQGGIMAPIPSGGKCGEAQQSIYCGSPSPSLTSQTLVWSLSTNKYIVHKYYYRVFGWFNQVGLIEEDYSPRVTLSRYRLSYSLIR